MAPADGGEVSISSAFVVSLIASHCALWHSSEVARCGCLYFYPEPSQEIVKLILEAKTVERGPLQMQPEYLLPNQLWNLTDAKAFS